MRTFIAIEIPPPIHSILHQEQQELERRLAAAHQDNTIRWASLTSIHLTLRFLGETTAAQRQLLCEALTRLTTGQKSFRLTVGEVGCFPNGHTPNIIWLGLRPEGQGLFQLQQQIEEAAQASGFTAEHKPFRPHLTIGRLRHSIARTQQRAIGQILTRELTARTQSHQVTTTFVVRHIVHMQSQLEPAGARYTPLQVFNFSEG